MDVVSLIFSAERIPFTTKTIIEPKTLMGEIEQAFKKGFAVVSGNKMVIRFQLHPPFLMIGTSHWRCRVKRRMGKIEVGQKRERLGKQFKRYQHPYRRTKKTTRYLRLLLIFSRSSAPGRNWEKGRHSKEHQPNASSPLALYRLRSNTAVLSLFHLVPDNA